MQYHGIYTESSFFFCFLWGEGTLIGMLLLLEHLLHQGLRHLEAVDPGAGAGNLAGQRDDGEDVAVANLDHEPVRVVEEELFHLDPPFLYSVPHVVDLHLLQLLLHRLHALGLQKPKNRPSNSKLHIRLCRKNEDIFLGKLQPGKRCGCR